MIERDFILGDEWIYFKVYTKELSADRILSEVLLPMVDSLSHKQIIDKWFFIRYIDIQGFHLRIRFHLLQNENVSRVIFCVKNFFSPYLDSGEVWPLTYDIYEREIERYGEDVYEMTESLFCIDSMCVITCLKAMAHYPIDNNLKWLVAIALVNGTMDSAGISLTDKRDLVSRASEAYRKEFMIQESRQFRMFDRKYREYREHIRRAVSLKGFPQEISSILFFRNERFKQILSSGRGCKIGDINHMTCNRLFTAENRLCELTLYELLSRYYTTEIARIKYSNPV